MQRQGPDKPIVAGINLKAARASHSYPCLGIPSVGGLGCVLGEWPAPSPIKCLLSGGFGEPLSLMRCTPAFKRPELRRRHGIDVESHVSSLREEALYVQSDIGLESNTGGGGGKMPPSGAL